MASLPALFLATENKGKLRELEHILSALPLRLETPLTRQLSLNVAETGSSYAENAALKALAFARATGLPALADDSGLEVDALDGAPGLYSARFSPKPGAKDADRRAYLLEKLAGLPRPWKAHFHCTIAIATPTEQVFYAEGNCFGEIIPEERGEHGFGYDPVFYMEEYQATMAELAPDLKNQISHRARAAQASLPLLRGLFHLSEV
ncbi:MAG TPA: RdgB/HAM1 family non-canonical purine NTP pyrophosphatase [Anaerolineaceae bacterium]|nr:RdgB/HAM1 family non-canonical purine NTP pyrophosphatase [Anaerolineaceae bacterium]HPN51774.1 RdgB/HAM1 family non-canonical purine NTP pyrophosphatase [Anaerolineaceae bacterium]